MAGRVPPQPALGSHLLSNVHAPPGAGSPAWGAREQLGFWNSDPSGPHQDPQWSPTARPAQSSQPRPPLPASPMSTLHFPQGGLGPLTAHTPGTLLPFQGPPPTALLSPNLSLISVGISFSLLGAQRASVRSLVIVFLTQERLASDGLKHIEIWPPNPRPTN